METITNKLQEIVGHITYIEEEIGDHSKFLKAEGSVKGLLVCTTVIELITEYWNEREAVDLFSMAIVNKYFKMARIILSEENSANNTEFVREAFSILRPFALARTRAAQQLLNSEITADTPEPYVFVAENFMTRLENLEAILEDDESLALLDEDALLELIQSTSLASNSPTCLAYDDYSGKLQFSYYDVQPDFMNWLGVAELYIESLDQELKIDTGTETFFNNLGIKMEIGGFYLNVLHKYYESTELERRRIMLDNDMESDEDGPILTLQVKQEALRNAILETLNEAGLSLNPDSVHGIVNLILCLIERINLFLNKQTLEWAIPKVFTVISQDAIKNPITNTVMSDFGAACHILKRSQSKLKS